MKDLLELLIRHGYWLLFAALLGRQACLPVPANLLLVSAGALAGFGKLNFFIIISLSIGALVLADLAWYQAGRTWGTRALHFICGSAHDPTSCVYGIVERFDRRGPSVLVVSKFVLGLDAIAAPAAGVTRVTRSQFLLFDAAGAALWSCAYATLGYFFRARLNQIAGYADRLGMVLILTGILVIGAMLLRRIRRWYRFLNEFRLSRITPEELRGKLLAGELILILDLENNCRNLRDKTTIPGAIRINPHHLNRYRKQYRDVNLDTDREVVLFCRCQGEITSARVASALRRRGFLRVRPLAGGLQAWRDKGYPVSNQVRTLPPPEEAAFVMREVFQYSPGNSARALNTSTTRVARLLERAKSRIKDSQAVARTIEDH